MSRFKENELVIYQNDDKYELGIVKRVIDDSNYFIRYHTGDTSARTHERNLHKVHNSYAFTVLRKSVESDIALDPCKQMAKKILDNINNHIAKEGKKEFSLLEIICNTLKEEEL